MVFSENSSREQGGEGNQNNSWPKPEVKSILTEAGKRHKEATEAFEKKFKDELRNRGVYNDFSLRRVVEMVSDGDLDFDDHQKQVYDAIKDLLEGPKNPNEAINPIIEDKNTDKSERLAA